MLERLATLTIVFVGCGLIFNGFLEPPDVRRGLDVRKLSECGRWHASLTEFSCRFAWQ